MKVYLTAYETQMAATVGVARQIEALRNGRKDAHGFAGDPFGMHIQGAVAEMAIAKAFGVYWDGLRATDALTLTPDVGDFEVRSTLSHQNSLIHHPEDDDGRAFVLVTGSPPYLWLRGWLFGSECRRDEWWREPPKVRKGGEAWFVPATALRPIETLFQK